MKTPNISLTKDCVKTIFGRWMKGWIFKTSCTKIGSQEEKFLNVLIKKWQSMESYCRLAAQLYPTLLRPHGLQPTRLLCPWDFPGQNTGVGFCFLPQRIFPTQGSNLCLLHWQADSLPLSYLRSPWKFYLKKT